MTSFTSDPAGGAVHPSRTTPPVSVPFASGASNTLAIQETTIIEHAMLERLDHVIDPGLGRSVTQLGMIANVTIIPTSDAPSSAVIGSVSATLTGDDPSDAARSDAYDLTGGAHDVVVDVELTVPGCPLSEQIAAQIEQAVASYPYARLTPHINVGTMADAKLHALVSDLKAARRENPFDKPGIRTRIFAVASGRAVRESLPSRRISRPSSQPSATTRRRASGHLLRPGMPLPPAPEPVLLDPTQSRLCLPALRQRQSTICFKKHRVIARNNLLQSAQAGKAFFRRNILTDVSDQLLCIGKPFRKWHLAQPHDVKHREQRIFNELTCRPPSPVFQCRWHVSFHRPALPVPFSATSFFLMNRKLSYCFFHPTI